MPAVKRIHHLAIAVGELDQALQFWQETLGLTLTERRQVNTESAEIAFFRLEGGKSSWYAPPKRILAWRAFWKSAAPVCIMSAWKWKVWMSCWQASKRVAYG